MPSTGAAPAQCPSTRSYSSTLSSTSDMASSSLYRERERERERQSRWAEGQLLVSVGSPEPAIPQPWTSCTGPAALSCRDALSAGPGCRLLSLLQPGLFPGSSSATGRNPQGQPTPGAKLRAHGHGERPLHEVLPVKHSEPPWGTRSSRAAQGRCVGGCTDTHR